MPKRISPLRRFAEATKYETRILGDIERMLLGRDQNEGRDQNWLHPSEICRADWCPKESYYRITQFRETGTVPARDPHAFHLETVFEEGHEIHRKWQGWIHDLGRLRGMWQCRHCGHAWEDISPVKCVSCDSEALRYREVPLFSEKYGIIGHADGDIVEGTDDDPLLEVKSVGLGTLRKEVPNLLAKYSHRVDVEGEERAFTDLQRLWRNIRRPLPTHLRQGNLYLHLSNRSTMIFIYEFKPTQATKEYVVRYQPSLIEDILDLALDVQWALKRGKPPERPHWAALEHSVCDACSYRARCWNLSTDGERDANEEHRRGTEPDERSGQGGTGEGGPPPPSTTQVRKAAAANKDQRVGRRHADEPVRAADKLGRSPQRRTRSSNGGRTLSRGVNRSR